MISSILPANITAIITFSSLYGYVQHCLGFRFLYKLEIIRSLFRTYVGNSYRKKKQLFAVYSVDIVASEYSVFPLNYGLKDVQRQQTHKNRFVNISIHFYFFNAHPITAKLVEVLIEFQSDSHLKINIDRTTIKQTETKVI